MLQEGMAENVVCGGENARRELKGEEQVASDAVERGHEEKENAKPAS